MMNLTTENPTRVDADGEARSEDRVSRRAGGALAIACVLILTGGCARQVVVRENPTAIDAREYARMFQAGIDELRDQGFEIDRQDYRFGVITTRPLGSSTIAEPWRGDNSTLGQAVESTVNDEQRIVSIHLEPDTASTSAAEGSSNFGGGNATSDPTPSLEAAEGPDTLNAVNDSTSPPSPAPPPAPPTRDCDYQLRIEVLVQRHQIPVRRLSGSTTHTRMFNTLRAEPSDLQDRRIPRNYWMDVGRDELLERRLMAAIVRRSLTLPAPQ